MYNRCGRKGFRLAELYKKVAVDFGRYCYRVCNQKEERYLQERIFNTPKEAFDELRPGFEGATQSGGEGKR